jgi:chemotaxis protein CheD
MSGPLEPRPAGFEHKLIVGIAELAVANNPDVTLVTYSLGSCLGVVIYDPVARVAGLLHAMLPDSSIAPQKAAAQPGMFVDTGIPNLFRSAYGLGAQKHRISIIVAGGAQVMDSSGFFNIGKRNVEALYRIVADHGLRVMGEQIGGLVNRTLYFRISTGELRLKISGQPKELVLSCRTSTNT